MASMNKKEIRVPTGADLLDMVVGGGQGFGYPVGRIINLVGDKSSGKTFLACEIIAAAYYLFGKKLVWDYDDAESGFTFDTKELYGIEIMPKDESKRRKSKTVEEFYCNYRDFLEGLTEGQMGIYIMDSLDGLSSEEIQTRGDQRYAKFKKGEKLEKGSYQMASAKFLSQEFFKSVTDLTEKKNALLIIISQTRDKINSTFPMQTRAGGRALDFYAHTALWLSTITKVEKKGRAVSVVVKALTKKSKTPRPFRSCVFTLIFDYGLDNVGSNLDFLFDLRGDDGKLKKAASSILWAGDSCEEVTVKSLMVFLKEHGKEEEFKEDRKRKGGLTGKGPIRDWILQIEELQAPFRDKFGLIMKRSALIDWIEENGKQQELTEKVRAKWERIEEEIRTKRKKKYL